MEDLAAKVSSSSVEMINICESLKKKRGFTHFVNLPMFTFAIVLQIFLKKELHSLCLVVSGVGDDVDVAGEPRRLH